MVTLRCTQKLLRRVSEQPNVSPPRPTTLLGDWYANILFSKPQQLVVFVSERTLLPVMVPLKESHTVPGRLAAAVRDVLKALGVAPNLAEREYTEMQQFCYGRTENKRVLGSLNEFMFELTYIIHHRPNEPLLDRSLFLARSPSKPIGYNSPDRATLQLFGTGGADVHAIH